MRESPPSAPLVLSLAFVLFSGTMACTSDRGLCDPQALQDALQRAYDGDTVRAGVCRIRGSFTVPDGVTLTGAGAAQTILTSNEAGEPVVRMSPHGDGCELSSLSIETHGRAGVIAAGDGSARIEDVQVRAFLGLGIGAEELESIELSNVSVIGPVDSENALDVPPEPVPEEIATHGVALIRIRQADIQGLIVHGFALMGVLIVDGETEWLGGESSDNIGSGVIVHGGGVVLSDLVLCGGLQGLHPQPPYAGVFTDGARVVTHRLEVCNNERVGLLHDDVAATHNDLVAYGNLDAALWVQNTQAHLFELLGDSELTHNGLAGVVLRRTGEVRLDGGRITETEHVTTRDDEIIGDGVHLIEPRGRLTISNFELMGNERVGVVIDVDEEVELDLVDVTVDGTGEMLGAVIQGDESSIPDGWDEGVTRMGATLENDLNFVGILAPVETIVSDDMPNVVEVVNDGLVAITRD